MLDRPNLIPDQDYVTDGTPRLNIEKWSDGDSLAAAAHALEVDIITIDKTSPQSTALLPMSILWYPRGRTWGVGLCSAERSCRW